MVQRRHVDLVDVGPLFAIDFDVDEQLVHHARRFVVLKALVRHDMAPVAGRVPTESSTGLSVRFASANASGPQAHQSTGLSLC